MPPPPLDRVLKQITLWQIKCIIRDLNAEAERVKAQKSRRGGWRVGDGAGPPAIAPAAFRDEAMRRWQAVFRRIGGQDHGVSDALETLEMTGRDRIEDVTDVETFISNFDDKETRPSS